MAPSCAPHITRSVVRDVIDQEIEDRRQPPWQPVLAHASLTLETPPETEEEKLERRARLNQLAGQAQARYEQWLAESPPPRVDSRPQTSSHPNAHCFRDRNKERELPPKHWQNPNRVLHERERIEAVLNSSLYMVHPPYPKQGGGIKNHTFSYMSAGYDYRQRLPSKEIAGTVSMLRTRARTESERINEVLQEDSLRDALAGGRWTFDPKYGNPPHCSPICAGSPFRSNSPQRWLRAARGGFETSFPPGTADSQALFLHHDEPYVDRVHPVVAPNVRCGSRAREPEKELGESFSSSVPLNTNIVPPSPPATAKTWRRTSTTQSSIRAGLV